MHAKTKFNSTAKPSIGQDLIKNISANDGLLSLGAIIMRVLNIIELGVDGAVDLGYYVMSDTCLSKRILQLANSQTYRKSSGTPITTITRAISIIGFNGVRNAATSILILETLANTPYAHSVRAELEISLVSSLIARELGRFAPFHANEEAALGALFRNLGALVVASHEHDLYKKISEMAETGNLSQSEAEAHVLGCSYDNISSALLKVWQMPEVILKSIEPLPDGQCSAASNRALWLRQVVSFSSELGRLIVTAKPSSHSAMKSLLHRYGSALSIDINDLDPLIYATKLEVRHMLEGLKMSPYPTSDGSTAELSSLLKEVSLENQALNQGCYPSGKPLHARELLLEDIQRITRMAAEGGDNGGAIVLAFLHALCDSMGYHFATLCLRDGPKGYFRARMAVGAHNQKRKEKFIFPLEIKGDIFHLAMENNVDLVIDDTNNSKILPHLPEWYSTLFPDAGSFIVLPLRIKGTTIGLFYADRTHSALEGIPSDEASLIRALKNLASVAICGN